MEKKICPICKIEKSVNDFNKYFSHERQKYRVQNYCKACEKTEKRRRSKEYYENKKEERKQYARDYRANPNNKLKRRKLEQYFKKKYRDQLQDCYVADALAQRIGVSAKDVRNHPTLIEDYRGYLKLIRTIKKRRNEK